MLQKYSIYNGNIESVNELVNFYKMSFYPSHFEPRLVTFRHGELCINFTKPLIWGRNTFIRTNRPNRGPFISNKGCVQKSDKHLCQDGMQDYFDKLDFGDHWAILQPHGYTAYNFSIYQTFFYYNFIGSRVPKSYGSGGTCSPSGAQDSEASEGRWCSFGCRPDSRHCFLSGN